MYLSKEDKGQNEISQLNVYLMFLGHSCYDGLNSKSTKVKTNFKVRLVSEVCQATFELRGSLRLRPPRDEGISLPSFPCSLDLALRETHWDDDDVF